MGEAPLLHYRAEDPAESSPSKIMGEAPLHHCRAGDAAKSSPSNIEGKAPLNYYRVETTLHSLCHLGVYGDSVEDSCPCYDDAIPSTPPKHCDGQMPVTVKMTTGMPIFDRLHPHASIMTLKLCIECFHDILTPAQYLHLSDKTLNNTHTLRHYNVHPNNVVHLDLNTTSETMKQEVKALRIQPPPKAKASDTRSSDASAAAQDSREEGHPEDQDNAGSGSDSHNDDGNIDDNSSGNEEEEDKEEAK